MRCPSSWPASPVMLLTSPLPSPPSRPPASRYTACHCTNSSDSKAIPPLSNPHRHHSCTATNRLPHPPSATPWKMGHPTYKHCWSWLQCFVPPTSPAVWVQLPEGWDPEVEGPAREALLERGLLLFKLIGNLHAQSDLLPTVWLPPMPLVRPFVHARLCLVPVCTCPPLRRLIDGRDLMTHSANRLTVMPVQIPSKLAQSQNPVGLGARWLPVADTMALQKYR